MSAKSYNRLIRLLRLQQALLREGNFNKLTSIAREIEITSEMLKTEKLDKQSLENLSALCKRNSDLTAAALRGISDAKRLLALLRGEKLNFETYSIPK